MAKRKLSRLVAALLTMAMAFSLCATPASAAWGIQLETTLNDEKVAVVISNESVPKLVEIAKEQMGDALTIPDWVIDLAAQIGSSGAGELVLGMFESQMKEYGLEKYDGTVPSNAFIGIVNTSSDTTYWYSEEDVNKVIDTVVNSKNGADDLNIDLSTGVVSIGDETLEAIPESELKYDSGLVTALLIVGGVAVAATTVYYWTHPDAWHKVVNKVQSTWNKITGKAARTSETEETTEVETEPEETAETTVKAA
jgi:hypothetical protein